jgi:hypothetical protein
LSPNLSSRQNLGDLVDLSNKVDYRIYSTCGGVEEDREVYYIESLLRKL